MQELPYNLIRFDGWAIVPTRESRRLSVYAMTAEDLAILGIFTARSTKKGENGPAKFCMPKGRRQTNARDVEFY